MSAPKLSQIDLWIQEGELPKALQGLREWSRAYLPELENDSLTAQSRINKADRDRRQNDITEDQYQVEYAKIVQVANELLSRCRLSGIAPEDSFALQDFHKHTCDRVPQNDRYQDLFLQSKGKKAQFYYIYGDEQQSHEGFFRRVCKDLEGRLSDYLSRAGFQASRRVEAAEITFDYSANPDIYRLNVLKSLFGGLGVSVNQQEPLLEKTLRYAWEKSPRLQALTPDDYVCVLIQISQWDWDPQLTPDTARWFIYEFAKDALPPESPNFLFFLGVEFDGTNDGVRKEVEAAVEEGKELKALPELGMVQYNDIGRWFSKYRILAPTTPEQRQLMDAHFARDRAWYMEEVEIILEKIIHEFNNKHLR